MPIHISILLLLLLPALSSCGWLFGDEGYFRDKRDDYREAKAMPEMLVPEGLDGGALQHLYTIPADQSSSMLVGDFEVPRPEPLRSAEALATVRIQKLGDDRWILMESTPGEVWPHVRSFLLNNRLGVENEDVAIGTIESAWLNTEDKPNEREKYRYRVEQGIQRRSSEVYIQQASLPSDVEVLPETLDWSAHLSDAEREEWMVGELASWLANLGESSSVSLMAQGLSTASKMYLVRDDQGRQVIDLRLPFDRAWASLGRALQKGEFDVTDLDRDGGRYYVRYEPGQEDKPGFIGRIFRRGPKDQPGTGISYIVDVNKVDVGVLVGIRREDGESLEEEITDLLLGVIRGNLS